MNFGFEIGSFGFGFPKVGGDLEPYLYLHLPKIEIGRLEFDIFGIMLNEPFGDYELYFMRGWGLWRGSFVNIEKHSGGKLVVWSFGKVIISKSLE